VRWWLVRIRFGGYLADVELLLLSQLLVNHVDENEVLGEISDSAKFSKHLVLEWNIYFSAVRAGLVAEQEI
jgi:hypothetical protein